VKRSLISALLIFLWAVRPAFSAENFDAQKLVELERLQAAQLEDSLKSKTPETAAEPSEPPPVQGVQRVSDQDLNKPPEVVAEEFKVITRKKTLLERLALSLHSSMNYDSNVFRERHARGDFYYVAGGGVELDASDLYKELGFVLTYTGDWNQYFSFARLNHYNQGVNIDLPGYGKRLRIGKKITVTASVGFNITNNNTTSSQDQNFFVNSFQPFVRVNADYLISKKFSTDFTYNYALRRTGNTAETSTGQVESQSGRKVTLQENDFAHRLKYHITPKTFTFAGFAYGFTTDNGGGDFDSKYFRLTGGIEGKITHKSVASFEAGWQHRTFKSGRSTDNSLYLKGAYLVQFTEKWSGQITAIRDSQASLFESTGFFTTTAVDIGVTYRPTQKMMINTDTFFRYNQVTQNSSTSSTSSTVNTNTDDENSFSYGVDSSIRYYVRRWLSMDLAYRLEIRRAKSSDNEYVDHLATFGITVGPISKWKSS